MLVKNMYVGENISVQLLELFLSTENSKQEYFFTNIDTAGPDGKNIDLSR